MPSKALSKWLNDRQTRLELIDQQCDSAVGAVADSGEDVDAPEPTALGHEILQGYVMLLSGHFQGFCRDLYSECSYAVSATSPPI